MAGGWAEAEVGWGWDGVDFCEGLADGELGFGNVLSVASVLELLEGDAFDVAIDEPGTRFIGGDDCGYRGFAGEVTEELDFFSSCDGAALVDAQRQWWVGFCEAKEQVPVGESSGQEFTGFDHVL